MVNSWFLLASCFSFTECFSFSHSCGRLFFISHSQLVLLMSFLRSFFESMVFCVVCLLLLYLIRLAITNSYG